MQEAVNPKQRDLDLSAARSEIQNVLRADEGLQRLRARVEERMQNDFDAGHDVAHCLRVATNARALDPDIDARELIAAALLHDVVNLPKNHPERSDASRRSAELAREWLPDHGFGAMAIARIADAIEAHSFSRGLTPTSALGRALQDADRLETLGAIGLMRVFSTGARMGARYFEPEDPWAEARPLDDLRFSIDHFATKLLALPATMCTAAGRAEGERRAAVLMRFLDDLALELAVPRPR